MQLLAAPGAALHARCGTVEGVIETENSPYKRISLALDIPNTGARPWS